MNLRISLILVIVLAWASVGAAWFVKSGTGEEDTPTPPFFYTLSTEDMRTITIATEDDSITWEFDLETRRWWFGDLEDIPDQPEAVGRYHDFARRSAHHREWSRTRWIRPRSSGWMTPN